MALLEIHELDPLLIELHFLFRRIITLFAQTNPPVNCTNSGAFVFGLKLLEATIRYCSDEGWGRKARLFPSFFSRTGGDERNSTVVELEQTVARCLAQGRSFSPRPIQSVRILL